VAFGRIGIRRTEVTPQHLADANTEANLLQVEISNKVPNLWKQELYTQALTEGTATYTLPTRTIAIRDAYLTTTVNGVSQDRVLYAMSTSQYDAQPNKTLTAPPQAYWNNKLMTQTITLWPVPDGNADYTLNLRLLAQVQDASLKGGATLDMPYRFLDVFVAGLAHRLARIYAADKEVLRKADYLDAWANAAGEDVEDNTTMTISPDFSGYYRR
jgi:hypothetical protein